MDNAEQILVIIVSSVLTIFLIVAIAAVIYIIKVLKQVKKITAQAERMASSVESAADMLGRNAGSLNILKVIAGIISQVNKSKKRR